MRIGGVVDCIRSEHESEYRQMDKCYCYWRFTTGILGSISYISILYRTAYRINCRVWMSCWSVCCCSVLHKAGSVVTTCRKLLDNRIGEESWHIKPFQLGVDSLSLSLSPIWLWWCCIGHETTCHIFIYIYTPEDSLPPPPKYLLFSSS